MVNSLDHSSRI